MSTARRLKVGAVSYLNTRPLIEGWERLAADFDLVVDLPSRLADRLSTGELDVALIPSIEYFQDPSYAIISDACIACRGPVWSVKLLSRVAPAEIRTLAMDEGSRTSACLTRILLWQRYGIRPVEELLPIGAGVESTAADAILLIGDRAIHSPPGEFQVEWDLGAEWVEWSGLPFVFAMWIARPGLDTTQLTLALQSTRDCGLSRLEAIAERSAAEVQLTPPECLRYLRDNLYFYLGPRERQGLEKFRSLAQALGMAPQVERSVASGTTIAR
ncbi:MAG: menaquinone biosynthetic enzyme MqnA/MqnD family protein [Planctomycetota bacterium]